MPFPIAVIFLDRTMSSDIINTAIQFILQAKESASAQLVTLNLEDQQTQFTIAVKLWREKMEIVKPDLISSSVTIQNVVVAEFGRVNQLNSTPSNVRKQRDIACTQSWHYPSHQKVCIYSITARLLIHNIYCRTSHHCEIYCWMFVIYLLANIQNPKYCHRNPELHIKSCLLSTPTKFGPSSTWLLSQVVHIQLPMLKNLV